MQIICILVNVFSVAELRCYVKCCSTAFCPHIIDATRNFYFKRESYLVA